MLSNVITAMKSLVMKAAFVACRIFPIQKNKIVFSSFLGKGYGDNGKAIIEELIRDGKHYDIVWLTDAADHGKVAYPSYIRTVPIKSIRSVYEQATAKVWVDNRRKPLYVLKRKQQFYMVTNHGNNGLKKVELDVQETLTKRYIQAAIHDSKMADVFLSSSAFDTWCFRNAYGFTGEMLEKGYPRQDILFADNREKIAAIRESLGIPAGKKVVLYAPTFRQALQSTDLRVYDLDWNRVLGALTESFDAEWVGLVRLHPNISQLSSGLHIPEAVKDVTAYPDFDELVLVSDVVITDYSSSIIEAGISGRVGLFFATDLEDYKKERNFYIPLEEWPFPLATSNDALVENIRSFDPEVYRQQSEEFFHGKYQLFTPGKASFYAAERIRAEMNR